jgi:hypothetical protein
MASKQGVSMQFSNGTSGDRQQEASVSAPLALALSSHSQCQGADAANDRE